MEKEERADKKGMDEKGMEEKSRKKVQEKKPLGIYLHIPFCVRKCNYCDFLSAPAADSVKTRYVEALCREIEAQAPLYHEHEVKTVFFGGGTPSLLEGGQVALLLERLSACFSFGQEEPEISLEANPGTVDGEKLAVYRKAGVNRLSFGLQSVREEELRLLGRIHTWKDFLESYQAARKAGFTNINVDLMSALPGQSVDKWMESLKKVVGLEPEHISAYSLIVEEGTPFYDWYHEQDGAAEADEKNGTAGRMPPFPSEEEDRLMYEKTGEYLCEKGYGRYEISNYARPGYACRHNLSYWERTDYAGFGLGAASLRENMRWNNTREMETYLQQAGEPGLRTRIKLDIQCLDEKEAMEEFMFLGLRKTEGISARRFEMCFHRKIENVYGSILQKLEGEGLLLRKKGAEGEIFFRLSPFGIDVSNYVLAQFLFS
mgnify:FL=1